LDGHQEQGKLDSALKVLAKIRQLEPGHWYVQEEIGDILRQIENERGRRIEHTSLCLRAKDRLAELGKKGIRNRVMIGIVLQLWVVL
jgi:hypothetical protein